MIRGQELDTTAFGTQPIIMFGFAHLSGKHHQAYLVQEHKACPKVHNRYELT